MPHKRYRLTHSLIEAICQRIRLGAFEHVAAEVEGIPRDQFKHWLWLAAKPGASKIYRDLKDAVMQAKAYARFMAESKMRLENPRTWLLHGIGKETAQTIGWSRPTAAMASPENEETINIFKHPEILRFLMKAREILLDYPEVYDKVTRALAAEINFTANKGGFQGEDRGKKRGR